MFKNTPPKRTFFVPIGLVLLLAVILISALNVKFLKNKMEMNRIGFGMSTSTNAAVWADNLEADWYLDWKTTPRRADLSPEYWQMVRLSREGTRPATREIIALAIEFPGHTWVIGNEPDNAWQDNINAEVFAGYYHDLYLLIKRYDPTARVAVGAVSQPTPLRLSYLDQVLETYHKNYAHYLPTDWWTIHAYVLREEENSWGAGIPIGFPQKYGQLYEVHQHIDLNIFRENVTSFRIWMKANGYQKKPLAVTEYGVLLPEEFGFTSEIIAGYLQESSKFLYDHVDPQNGLPGDNFHLVQKFAWFSLADKVFPAADLANIESGTITAIGEAFLFTSIALHDR